MQTYEQQLDANWQLALREGSMYFEGDNAVHKTLHRIAQRLDELGIDYAIADGMCLFRHGFRRFTQDVDVLVTRESLARIHEELEGRGYVKPFCRQQEFARCRNRRTHRFHHQWPISWRRQTRADCVSDSQRCIEGI